MINCIIWWKDFSLIKVTTEIGKKYFLIYHHNDCLEEKRIIKNMNLLDTFYHWKKFIWLDKYDDNVHFEKNSKVKKQ